MRSNSSYLKYTLFLAALILFTFSDVALAQRLATRGGGSARPAASRPASRPASNPTARPTARPASKPTASRPTTANSSRPTASRPSSNGGMLNGGSNRVTNTPKVESKVGSIKNSGNSNSGNRMNNVNTGDRGSNNRVNVDRSRGDVNINVDNSRNTVIRNNRNVAYRPPYRPYVRPPYVWGGYGFSWYRPYYYHPFTPFYWGPVWHPWGFFVATLAVTAIVISVDNQDYHYDEGVFYVQDDDGYVVVEAPQGATVKVIPKNSEVVEVSPTINNYYYGGTFYEQKDGTYTVVPPPAGSVVSNLPEGAEEVKVGDQTFVKYGDTYYMPVEVDGKNMYEIVQAEPEEGD